MFTLEKVLLDGTENIYFWVGLNKSSQIFTAISFMFTLAKVLLDGTETIFISEWV